MKKLFWLDIETTGIEAKDNLILEVAAVVTNPQLEPLAQFSQVIHHPTELVESKLNGWCRQTHTRSGLLAEVARSERSLADVEGNLIHFARTEMDDQEPGIRLAGSSIHFDRNYLHLYMPNFETLLHYRMIDASAFFEIQLFYGLPTVDKVGTNHRALPDLLNHSIPNFKHSLQVLNSGLLSL